jgi:hypothetical protein
MNKLRFHFIIVALCYASFLLIAGTIAFRKAKVDFDAGKKSVVGVKDNHRLVNVTQLIKINSPKNEDPPGRNEKIK